MNFWEHKKLNQLSEDEWESLCDGCGQCCLVKLQDEETDEIVTTSVACKLLDIETCRCQDYPQRLRKVTGCTCITAETISTMNWLPDSCAYRCLDEGRPLPEWHHLRTGDQSLVLEQSVSVKWFAISELYVHEDQIEDFVIDNRN